MPQHPLLIAARTLSVEKGPDHALEILARRAGTLLRIFPLSASTAADLAELKHTVDQAEQIIRDRAVEHRREPSHSSPSSPSSPSSHLEHIGSRFD